ncbi:MAG: T9SS type A sorting domain-containing protein, partial [Chlorobi bacterium]|nr:T9SS type A sorting domain-containing protein [Chlorobiota bacterium]
SFLNTNNNRIDISKLVKGYYYLLIKDNNKIISFSFVKE